MIIGNNAPIQYPERQPSQPGSVSPPDETPREIGTEKELSQHVGNAGFGISSVASIAGKLGKVSRVAKAFKFVPGINLSVAAIESYNSAKKFKNNEPLVATSSAGNAAGCFGGFFEEFGAASLARGRAVSSGRFVNVGVALGVLGGALGIAAGAFEIKHGMKIKEASGSTRTLKMGYLDIASGITSLAGTALAATGSPLGIPLMVTSGFCDLAGIAMDYLGRKHSK